MKAKVIRYDGKLAVVIPDSIACDLQLQDGMTIEITIENDSLVIGGRRRRRRRSMAEIVAQIKPAHYRLRNRELDDWL